MLRSEQPGTGESWVIGGPSLAPIRCPGELWSTCLGTGICRWEGPPGPWGLVTADSALGELPPSC